jgi:hypothetical protein
MMEKIKKLEIKIDTDCRNCRYVYNDYSWFCGLFNHEHLCTPGLTSQIIPRCKDCIEVFGE